MLLGMFLITEADAAAIRAIFSQEGELSAAIELRRRFPGQREGAGARPDHRRMEAAAVATLLGDPAASLAVRAGANSRLRPRPRKRAAVDGPTPKMCRAGHSAHAGAGTPGRHDGMGRAARAADPRGQASPVSRRGPCQTMTGQLTITQPGEILAADTNSVLPALIAAAGDRAARRYVEFFCGDDPQHTHAPGLWPRRGGVSGVV
jgi:hypothetical protein